LPFRLDVTPGCQNTASPCLGADTRRILAEIVGLSSSEIEELELENVTSAIPV
jgi:crotonobetainyl-CoA:carnitine CoA-transferase CaiB-like acyl-CoA transferase